ncbi:MAG: ribokinase [Bacteroidales bacterium]|nr:ribokinase [Bacteroidales bacterium]
MKPRIVVIGSSNTDMIIKSPHLPGPGETVLGGSFTIVQGGKGANQAIASARAGGDVLFITCVGDDSFGQNSIAELAREGIDTSFVKIIKDVPSGVAMINVAETGENSISVAPGANSQLLPGDIINAEHSIKDADIVLMQLEIPIDTVAAAVKIAHKYRVPVILNPAPACILSNEILSHVDIITPNEREAALLAGVKATDNNFSEMARSLRKSGPGTVIITLGENGAFYFHDELEKHVEGYKVNVVDTTAAGDTFNGFLAVSLAQGDELEFAVRMANKAASLSVTRLGAQPSIPYIDEVMGRREVNMQVR